MSSPRYYDDGRFNVPQQNGATSFTFPFADKGDPLTFVARKRMRMASIFYTPAALMQFDDFAFLGRAYLVNRSDAADVGNGLVEWEDVWASLPKTRTEYGTISYTQQYFLNSEIIEYTGTRDASFIYEYSLTTPLPRILAPRLFQINNVIYTINYNLSIGEGQPVLAQDTEREIYMAQIFCRKSIYVPFHFLIQQV